LQAKKEKYFFREAERGAGVCGEATKEKEKKKEKNCINSHDLSEKLHFIQICG
jgi:hypothetical protein